MRKIIKITSYVFLICITVTLVYLASTLNEQTGYQINVIEINGADLLAVDQYYKFSKLDEQKDFEQLSLAVIKSRLEKHPYVKTAVVYYDGNNKVAVDLHEKEINSILFTNNEQFLLTEEFEVLPLLTGTKQFDFPALSNPSMLDETEVGSFMKNNIDIVTGYRILHTFKLVDAELYERLSEVNFRNGGDIVLTFSAFNYPIVIGRGNEVRKIYYFKKIWEYLKDDELNNRLNYIDLRYSNHIYLGFPDINEEEQI